MTNQDFIEDDTDQGFWRSDKGRMVAITIAALVYVVSLGAIIGIEGDLLTGLHPDYELPIILAGAVGVLIVTALWLGTLGLFKPRGEKEADSARTSRRSLLLALLAGIAISLVLFLPVASGGEPVNILSNEPINPFIAMPIAAVFAFACSFGSLHWHSSADEHDVAASRAGAFAAFHAFCVITPVWWMAERSGIAPAQEPMLTFAISIVVYAAVWTYKRGS